MHTTDLSISNTRLAIGKMFIGLGSLLLIGSSVARLAHVPKIVTELGAMGFDGDRLMAIAALEMLSSLLFLFRSTRSLGLLLVSAYMGGAIATHVGHGSSPMQPVCVLAVLWLGAYLCHPESVWSFRFALRSTGDMRSPAEVRGS